MNGRTRASLVTSKHQLESDTKKAKTQGHQINALPSIKGMCWNVRGLTTVLEEPEKLAHDHNPDFNKHRNQVGKQGPWETASGSSFTWLQTAQ